jgi:hypothetical protein
VSATDVAVTIAKAAAMAITGRRTRMCVPIGSQAIDSARPGTDCGSMPSRVDQYIGRAVSGILRARAKLNARFPA